MSCELHKGVYYNFLKEELFDSLYRNPLVKTSTFSVILTSKQGRPGTLTYFWSLIISTTDLNEFFTLINQILSGLLK